jgi:hypothetical protein
MSAIDEGRVLKRGDYPAQFAGLGVTTMPDPGVDPIASIFRCPECGERAKLFVRISALAALIRDDGSADGLSMNVSEKTPADYQWVALHCGACGHEGSRQEFEPPQITARPGTDEPSDAVRAALKGFIETIDATVGCFQLERIVLVPDWSNLADAYCLACRALGREPTIRLVDGNPDESVSPVNNVTRKRNNPTDPDLSVNQPGCSHQRRGNIVPLNSHLRIWQET